MLKPKYIEQLPNHMIELYSQAEMDILADMARRISTYDYFIPAAEWQYKKLIELGNFHSFIMEALSSMTGLTRQEIERLMEEAGMKALAFDDEIYRKAGLNPPPLAESPTLQSVLAAGIEKTGGLFTNLTRTTANTATKQFEDALDRAYMQITTGAFDYNATIRTAVKDLASKGVAVVRYPSGHVDYMEVAVRRATVTGVNQTAAKLQESRADEMGSDLVEVTAHAGARPDHQVWQGKIFSRSGTHPKYPDFVSSTGYGTGPGLCGWNCRHNFFPYFEGISEPAHSNADLEEMNDPKYTYNDQKLTEYEATQQQRHIERQIRKWKREYTGMEAAGQPTEEAAAKIAQWQRTQKDFLEQTGLKRQVDREQIPGFGKSSAQKVTWSQKKKVKEFAEQHISSVETLIPAAPSDIINHQVKSFSNRTEADKLFRPWTEEAWSRFSSQEQRAAYEYTAESGRFNRPLRGYDKSWDNFAGVGQVDLNNEGAGQMIRDLRVAIEKVEVKKDVWLFRGSDQQSLAGLLGIDKSKIIPSKVSALNKKFAGTPVTDTAFFSTGVAADAGFHDKISYEILAPKGTKGIYAEPFSSFGGANTNGTWDGKQKGSYIGGEAEMILQAGTPFIVKEIKLVSEKITIVLEVMK